MLYISSNNTHKIATRLQFSLLMYNLEYFNGFKIIEFYEANINHVLYKM